MSVFVWRCQVALYRYTNASGCRNTTSAIRDSHLLLTRNTHAQSMPRAWHFDLWPLRAVKWPSASFSHRFGLYLDLHQKVTVFRAGLPLINNRGGLLKGGCPLLNAGVWKGQHPLAATRFFEVGRRPETSLVDSWQPTPPEETQITGAPCVTL